ncbi:MAG: type II toxin-antitoxin system mRNA interferase toxin, RelE/StbE family [Geminocystis sp. GBBB08]|nr:type II toxin-antitoxin system mRNA interferase toxin, RelE/StbE family [Geminocystis sp. GBBB08]
MIRKNSLLRNSIERILTQLAEDPFHPSLYSHKLKGDLSQTWSCSIDYSYRIIFQFIDNEDKTEQAILLINLGSHDDVY